MALISNSLRIPDAISVNCSPSSTVLSSATSPSKPINGLFSTAVLNELTIPLDTVLDPTLIPVSPIILFTAAPEAPANICPRNPSIIPVTPAFVTLFANSISGCSSLSLVCFIEVDKPAITAAAPVAPPPNKAAPIKGNACTVPPATILAAPK